MSSIDPHQRQRDPSLTRPQDTLLSNMGLPHRKSFFPLGFAVDILTNRLEVLTAAETSFGHRELQHSKTNLEIRIGVSESKSTQSPPLPTRRQYNHLYSMMADIDNQALLDLRTGSNFVWLSTAALKDELYLRHNFLEKVVFLLLGASVVTDIHAGCVSKRGKGILLCGDSGAGKSTLAYACARAGWTYTSDDTCYLINDSVTPRVAGHSHKLRFRPEARTLFPELQSRAITRLMEGKPSIEVSSSDLCLPVSHEVDVSAIVYLRRSRSSRAALVPLPRGSATRLMSDELFSAGEIRIKHQRVLERLREVATFELHYESLDQALFALEGLASAL